MYDSFAKASVFVRLIWLVTLLFTTTRYIWHVKVADIKEVSWRHAKKKNTIKTNACYKQYIAIALASVVKMDSTARIRFKGYLIAHAPPQPPHPPRRLFKKPKINQHRLIICLWTHTYCFVPNWQFCLKSDFFPSTSVFFSGYNCRRFFSYRETTISFSNWEFHESSVSTRNLSL